MKNLFLNNNTINNLNEYYRSPIALNILLLYNLGFAFNDIREKIRMGFREDILEADFFPLIEHYKDTCHFLKYRKKFAFLPENTIKEKLFCHQQEYLFRLHCLKLKKLSKSFPEINKYLQDIYNDCPEELFKKGPRCSKSMVPDASFERVRDKNNIASSLTDLALCLTKNNRERHSVVQNFMLINDNQTIAVEVPVYIYPHEIPELKLKDAISGHIDILQIKKDKVLVLDYKPEARYNKNSSNNQVFLYKIALSKRTGIPQENIKCACFDDKDYFEVIENHEIHC